MLLREQYSQKAPTSSSPIIMTKLSISRDLCGQVSGEENLFKCPIYSPPLNIIKHCLHVCLIVSHPRRGAIQKFKILTDQFSFLAFCILSSDFVVNAGMIWVTFEFDIFLYLHFVIDLALHTPGNIRNCKMLFD